ncbi:hypothetical protein FRC11_011473 [Ceratobasidium sp. 423]|nr:hypothetical protein FRC11_011473 [Ceratobasidium sp. 423]
MARRATRPDFGIPDSHPLHPKWGRTLNDYTTSYDIEEMKRRLVVTEGMLAKAQEAMTCICDEGEEERVTPSMLQSVLVLAQSPLTFRYFSKPDLIKGCLRLMATVKRQAEPSVCSAFGFLVDF